MLPYPRPCIGKRPRQECGFTPAGCTGCGLSAGTELGSLALSKGSRVQGSRSQCPELLCCIRRGGAFQQFAQSTVMGAARLNQDCLLLSGGIITKGQACGHWLRNSGCPGEVKTALSLCHVGATEEAAQWASLISQGPLGQLMQIGSESSAVRGIKKGCSLFQRGG